MRRPGLEHVVLLATIRRLLHTGGRLACSMVSLVLPRGVFNSANAAGFFETANGIRGDVVVLKSSQLNGQSEQAASLFPSTIHSGPVFDIGGTTIRPETNHPDIADRVRELLSTPAVGIDWQGDISR